MKIAAVLENKIDTGGGFSMSVDLLLTIQDAAKKSKSDFIIINLHKENSNYLKTLNIEHITISDSFFDKIFAFINTNLLGMYLNSKFKLKTFFEKKLLQNKIDFVFFVTPSARPFYLQELNYAITVFDVCHIEYPEFSEVNSFNIFYLREKILKMCVGPATYVITESEKLKKKISSIYNKDINRIISIPNRPSPFLKYSKINKKFSIFSNLPKRFFFYPAQFWEHKNHIKILYSLYKLKKKVMNFTLSFAEKIKAI